MKKLFLFIAVVLYTATAFAGDGTAENPYSCAEAIALQKASDYSPALVWVKGFIVGMPVQGKGGVITFTTEIGSANCQQIMLADDVYGTNAMPVELTMDARTDLNLCEHESYIGQKVRLRTVPQSYFAVPGAKNSSEYALLEPIAVTGVSLDKSETEIFVNQMFTLVATVEPADADNRRVVWSSDNAGVASVDAEGNVTALTNGEATITVTTVDGAKIATCKVTVTTASGEVLMGDVITADTTGVGVDSYTIWSDKTCLSGTKYAGKSATASNAIKITSRTSTSDSKKETGIVNTSNVGYLRQVELFWNSQNADGRKVQVLASNEPITSAADLYANIIAFDTLGVLEYATNDVTATLDVTKNYRYVGLLAVSSNATYFDKVVFTWSINKTADDIELQSLALDTASLELEEAATYRLKVAYTPADATYKAVTWTSSNTAVATVEAGMVTAVAPGEADITVTSVNNPALTAKCHVVVTEKDIFAGRDIYYKVKSISELHTNDTVVFVCEKYNRVSGEFELSDNGVGRIVTPSTEIVREGDRIGAWGAEEVHLVAVEGGKWQILVKQWLVDELGIDYSEEVPLRAAEVKNLQIKGEGTQTWTIAFFNDGDSVVIENTDTEVGRLQFNGSNKTFCNYTSNQTAIQIYRMENQTVSDDDPIADPDNPDVDGVQMVTLTGVSYANGIVYNEQGLPLRIYSVAGYLMAECCTNVDISAFAPGVYIVRAAQGLLKIVK
ncbi:MAG: Ig-like domain-containing protein [Paludibacteraceae bacterium]